MATSATVMKGMDRLFGAGTLAGRTDAQLLDAFVGNRDESAFACLVARHGPMVLATCRAVLRDPAAADDAFQATFVVLARKAGAVRGRDALGGWLHRVAYRTSVQAARDAARRQVEERKAAEMRANAAVREEMRDDLRAAVHAEVERLPETLRLPVVLCDLEGRTREQAAEELRWTEWAVRGRLDRGRAKLRHRLKLRGLAPSAAMGAAVIARESAAAVPEALAAVTIRTAMATIAGRAAGTAVVALATKVARTMVVDRIRSTAILSLATVALAGASIGLVMMPRQKEGMKAMPAAPKMIPPAAGNDQAKSKPPAVDPAELRKTAEALLGAIRGDKPRTYHGVVVDPAGRPAAGARVFLLFVDNPLVPRTTTGPDGRFSFTAYGPSNAEQLSRVAAEAEGYAVSGFATSDFVSGPPDDGRDLTIKLVPDQPVEGLLVDLEGRPIAGATVSAEFVYAPKQGDLEPYLRALKGHEDSPDQLRNSYLTIAPVQFLLSPQTPLAKTDAAGRFVVKGLGRDRLVNFKIQAPTIRPLDIEVITRPGEPFRVPMFRGDPQYGMKTFYGASPRLAASPSRPIEGFVRDHTTGEPVAAANINSYRLADQELGNNTIVQTKSDAKGHYRLVGMPRGAGNEVMIIPPAGAPYLPAMAKVIDPPGLGPVAFDMLLDRGVAIEGRVVDEGSGKPVAAWVTYHVAVDNPALDSAPAFREMQYAQSYMLKADTDPDGKFKLVGFPGRGVLVVETKDRSHPDDGQSQFRQDFVPVVQMFHQASVDIEIPKDAKTFTKEVRLDPGRTVEGTVVGPDDKPLQDAEVYGLQNLGYWETLPNTSTFKVVALVKGRPPRGIVFRHEKRKLAGWIDVRGDESGRPRIRLEPWGEMTGRIVDPEGKPRGEVTLEIHANKDRLGNGSVEHKPGRVRTDADGRFRVEGFAPGLGYQIFVEGAGGTRAAKPFDVAALKSGEARDMGDVKITYRNPGE